MRAIVQDSYGETALRLEEVPDPVPGRGELLIAVHASSLNAADWHIAAGTPYLVRAAMGLRRPRTGIAGRDLAGVVLEVGPGVQGFAPGDRVLGEASRAFAEKVVVRADQVLHLPEAVPMVQAAGIPLAGLTAWQALQKAGVEPGESVLVNGASGGVGSFAVQIAVSLGAEVTGVCSGPNADLVRSLGAARVIDYTSLDPTVMPDRYDVIVDNVINHPASRWRPRLAASGTYLGVGAPYGDGTALERWLGPLPAMAKMTAASVGRPVRMVPVAARPNRGLAELVDLVADGRVRVAVDHVIGLADVPTGIAYVGTGRARGKVLVDTRC
jgi:NADPH:quinone reductase-like Zn-dependent oxidoreductase